MARELRLYAFSAAIWKKAVREAGVDVQAGKGPELGILSMAVVARITTGQTPECPSGVDRFTNALGQSCIVFESEDELADIDGVPFADTKPKLAVARFLGQGRSFTGGALDPKAIYGWIESGSELKALIALVECKAWAQELDEERTILIAWLQQSQAAGHDVFFASQAHWLPATKSKKPSKSRTRAD